MTLAALQQENERLKALLAERDAALADRDAKIAKLAGDIAKLEAVVKHLLATRRRGQDAPEGQGLLFADATQAPEPELTADGPESADDDDNDGTRSPRRAQARSGKPTKIDTTGLPSEDRLHELPEDQRVCPETRQPLVAVGEKVFEEIDYRRAKLVVIRHRQVVYGLPPAEAQHRQAKPVVADLPPRPLEGCAASSGLLAWLLVQKYGNHLPLYRQEEIFERDGLRLPRQTLCDWTLRAAEALQPIVDCLMTRIRAGPVMQLDDTPVKCQGGKGEPNFQAYLWTFLNPEVVGVAYRFTSGRASDLIAAELGNFSGWLLGDGYSGNRAASEKVEGDIVLAGCWAHTVRKFRDAKAEAPATAKLFRDDFHLLYEVEREADKAGLSPEDRVALRQQKSRPILAALFARARRLHGNYSDAGKMGGAIGYLVNQRKPLRRFLEDGRIPLDNNSCERAIRPIAIGRRNWLFAGSVRGGRASAAVYSLIQSCRLAKVDVLLYLADVLVRVATHPASRVEELLPDRWTSLVAADKAAEPQLA